MCAVHAAWVACVADARPAGSTAACARLRGCRVTAVEHHNQALEWMIWQIAARLDLLKIIARPGLQELGVDLTRAGSVLDAAHTAVRDGILEYVLIVAHKA
jgi:arsenite methyltransferase